MSKLFRKRLFKSALSSQQNEIDSIFQHQPTTDDEEDNDEEDEDEDQEEDKKYNNPAEAAIEAVKNNSIRASHCWDWIEKIYKLSGFNRKTIYMDLNYLGRVAGNHRAGPNLLSQIQPGDWLFLNNQNTSDVHGNHSAIFLNWKGPNIAEIASFYDGAGHIHTYDINKFPVTAIMKAVPA